MKRRLIIIGGIAIIVLCLAGIAATMIGLSGFTLPRINQPPWQSGKPFAPVPIDGDPKLISYATAETIRNRMASELDLDGASIRPTYSFDDRARMFESEKPSKSGLIAAVSAYQSGDESAGDQPRTSTRVELYADTATRDIAVRAVIDDSAYPSTTMSEPRIENAGDTAVIIREGACAAGGGRRASIEAIAAVESRTIVRIDLSCTTIEQAQALIESATDHLTSAVTGMIGIEAAPLPTTLFDRAEEVPTISTGRWSDRQVVVDHSLGARGLRAVPVRLRAPGIELYLSGQYEVAGYTDSEAAASVLDRMLAETDPYDREIKERSGTTADRVVCAEGYRPREPSECLSQLGRFIVLSRAEQGKDPAIEDQLELLRGAR